MLKKLAVIVFVLALVMTATGCADKNSLEYKISKYIDENYEGERLIISLSDFTDFEWDRAIVVDFATRDISTALNIKYNGEDLDLVYGIIFVNGEEVAYREFFEPYRDNLIGFNDDYRFSMSARPDREKGEETVVFHSDAEFSFVKGEYSTGREYYRGYLKR